MEQQQVQEMLTAIISAVTSVLVVLVTYSLNSYREAKLKEKRDYERVVSTYLNPLRLSLVENYFRLSEILARVSESDRKHEALLYVDNAEEVSEKSSKWFNNHGCYLISSCYITARLFYYLDKVRIDLTYLKLSQKDDTELISQVTILSRFFRQGYGIYYLLQPSIGNDIYLASEQRLMTYREFCQLLQNPEARVWFDRLLNFYIEMGKGEQLKRSEDILSAIQNMSLFLDKLAGGGNSIQERLEIEGISSF
ncbi:MAG: hypothetical protein F6K00_28195 [Leptolyngbya sp. SIOISBB]|nr:hypothetical protein [Leptolyngbya sp. SIOISBB]